jgi:hypothetical protein
MRLNWRKRNDSYDTAAIRYNIATPVAKGIQISYLPPTIAYAAFNVITRA